MNTPKPMTDERLARLAADNEPAGDHLSGLTADEVAELVAEVKRWRGLADRGVDDLSADDEWDEIRQFREMLAVAREHAQTAHDQTAELGGHVVQLRAELAEAREAHLLSEAQLIEVTLERTEWYKRAQQHETVAKILRADLAAASRRAETAERELAEVRGRLGGYTIGCDGDEAAMWPYVACNRCRHDVWTGEHVRGALNLADAVDQAVAHDCDKAAELRDLLGFHSEPVNDPAWNGAVAVARALRGADDA